jgi:signal peptidase I
VSGSSMEPTLLSGDRLLVMRTRRVQPGDLVALIDPSGSGRIIVKRVGAVRFDEVVVLGDNAAASVDSRTFGAAPRKAILGKVIRRYHPKSRAGKVR